MRRGFWDVVYHARMYNSSRHENDNNFGSANLAGTCTWNIKDVYNIFLQIFANNFFLFMFAANYKYQKRVCILVIRSSCVSFRRQLHFFLLCIFGQLCYFLVIFDFGPPR